MKLFVVCLLGFVALSMAEIPSSPPPVLHPRGCIYIMGRCYRECEEGTHAYTTGCSQKMPEATCEVPNPVKERGILCDYSACYCDPPTLRHKSGKCVQPAECSKD